MSTIIGNPNPPRLQTVDSTPDVAGAAPQPTLYPVQPGLPQQIVDLLGTCSDRELGERLGVSGRIVSEWRRSRGIRSWRAGGPVPPHPHSPYTRDSRDTVVTPEVLLGIADEPWE